MERSVRCLVIPDQRGKDRFLRVTWHAETRTVTLSHWNGHICTASSRIALAESSKLIGFLVGTLQHAAAVAVSGPAPAEPVPNQPADQRVTGVRAGIRRCLQPHLAQVISLGERLRPAGHPGNEAGTGS